MIPGSGCDNHPTEPAIKAVCGEVGLIPGTRHLTCVSHVTMSLKKMRKNIGDCEWCGAVDVEIRPTRDQMRP